VYQREAPYGEKNSFFGYDKVIYQLIVANNEQYVEPYTNHVDPRLREAKLRTYDFATLVRERVKRLFVIRGVQRSSQTRLNSDNCDHSTSFETSATTDGAAEAKRISSNESNPRGKGGATVVKTGTNVKTERQRSRARGQYPRSVANPSSSDVPSVKQVKESSRKQAVKTDSYRGRKKGSSISCRDRSSRGNSTTISDTSESKTSQRPGHDKRTFKRVLIKSPLHLITSEFRKPCVLDSWSPLEIAKFEGAMCSYGKRFHEISKVVNTKTSKECVDFYYLIWKLTNRYRAWKDFRYESEFIRNDVLGEEDDD